MTTDKEAALKNRAKLQAEFRKCYRCSNVATLHSPAHGEAVCLDCAIAHKHPDDLVGPRQVFFCIYGGKGRALDSRGLSLIEVCDLLNYRLRKTDQFKTTVVAAKPSESPLILSLSEAVALSKTMKVESPILILLRYTYNSALKQFELSESYRGTASECWKWFRQQTKEIL